jgi:alkylhydroperoxidase/carboxymuconolactone decarboxylase family protein YurZ
MTTPNQPTAAGPWDAALEQLRDWDPKWAGKSVKMTTDPCTRSVLPQKFVELVGTGLNAACTNLNPGRTRRQIRAALQAGASREEILMVLKNGVCDVDPFLQPRCSYSP